MSSDAVVIEFEFDNDTWANIEITTLTQGSDMAIKKIAKITENTAGLLEGDDSTMSTLNVVFT